MVFDHKAEYRSEWAALTSIAAKIGCTGEMLRHWVRPSKRDQGLRAGPTMDNRERIKALERKNRELRQANEILRKARAYFAQAALDRRSSHDRVHRRSPPGPWCRADLQVAADHAMTYHAHIAWARDAELKPLIRRVLDENFQVCGCGKSSAS